MRRSTGLVARSTVFLTCIACAAAGRCQPAGPGADKNPATDNPARVGTLDWATMPTTSISAFASQPPLAGMTVPADVHPSSASQVGNAVTQLTTARDASPVSNVSFRIRRTQSEMQEAAPVNLAPMEIQTLPAARASEGFKYTTAEMTGPLQDAAALFSKLRIENDFRYAPVVFDNATQPVLGLDGYHSDRMYESYAWVSPTFYHQPLYFEQVNLERYGIGPRRCVQPLYSAGHFFSSILLMPYKLSAQHPCEHVYTLGNNRPGDCVPYQRHTLLGQSYPFEALHYFQSGQSTR